MKHALIISNDDAAARLLEDRLAHAGFDSFERAWSEDSALILAEQRRPDLVVVGERLDRGCPFKAARSICSAHDIPALFAATPGDVLPALPPDT